jgi:hypothetical protein
VCVRCALTLKLTFSAYWHLTHLSTHLKDRKDPQDWQVLRQLSYIPIA